MAWRLHATVLSLVLSGLLAQAPVSRAQPGEVLLVDVSAAAPDEHLLAVTLQGLANRHSDGPRVFLLTGTRDGEWLDYCLRFMPRATRPIDVQQLLDILKPEIAGQILYDPQEPSTINIATTAAGLRQAAVSSTDLGLPTLLDLRGRWQSAAEAERWAVASLLPACDHSKAALLPADAFALRDFVVQEQMFAVSLPESPEDEAFQSVLFHLTPGAALYGEAPVELRPALSRASHFLVPASEAANLSFLSRVETGMPLHQYVGHLEPLAPRFLTLVFDCSDLDFAINDMPALWEHPARGSLPLGWAVPAALFTPAAPAAHRYYADAYLSGTDQFILGPTGAGALDLSLATAPYTFFRATARARAGLDTTASLYAVRSEADLGAELVRFAAETGMRGVFVVGAPQLRPVLLDGIPALAAPRVASAAEAVDYLNRIPLDRRCAALLLDPRRMTPGDAAHIAAHVSGRFVIVPPAEMMELMRELSLPQQPGPAAVSIGSVRYPDPAEPTAPVPISVLIEAPGGLLSASAVYRRAGHPLAFAEPVVLTQRGYAAELPPLRPGGVIELSIRARDLAGRTAWSPSWSLSVAREDSDGDGLADAEEAFVLTENDNADTDGDGLVDGLDARPLHCDRVQATYLGPIRPPNDLPYLPEPGESSTGANGRLLQPGQTCLYWLPVALLPPGAPAVVALDAEGPATLSIAADSASEARAFSGELGGPWHSDILPPGAEDGGVFVRATCPGDAAEPLLIRELSITSPPEAPSIDRVGWYPAYPGPLQAIAVSAVVFGPRGVADVDLTYRVNGAGTITFPMWQAPVEHRYEARIPALENRDLLEWWITARDPQGNMSVTPPNLLVIGGRAREVVPLLAMRDFLGDWTAAPDWGGGSRAAMAPGLRDSAYAHLTGGTYTVWALAGGRGHGIELYVRDKKIGSVDPRLPDGWRRIGRVRLEAGRHRVHLISQPGAGAPQGAAPRYASVIFTTDSSFVPPDDRIFDMHNALTLLFPPSNHTLSGRVELLATGAGNLTSVEFSLDGQLLRRVSGPPFRHPVNTARLPEGDHTLKVEAVDRAGPTGLAIEVPVTIGRPLEP